MSSIFYDKTISRYRDKHNGQLVSRKETIRILEVELRSKINDFVNLSSDIKSGDSGAYKKLAQQLKEIHITQAIIGANGSDNLTQQDYGSIGSILKKQYYSGKDDFTGKKYGLKHLLLESPGLSEQMIKHRLTLYAQSSEVTKNTVIHNQKIRVGTRQMKRLLAPAEHCKECIYYASLGWQSISSAILPLPKQRCTCRSNCKCTVIYK